MALSNSQYDAIIREYGRQQLQNKHEQDKRVEEIYRRIPAVKELDDAISTTAVEAAKKVLGGEIRTPWNRCGRIWRICGSRRRFF